MKNNIVTMMSKSMNVIICPMPIFSIKWWINDKNIFPLTKGFIKIITDGIFDLGHALSSMKILIHPSVNKMFGKVSASTLLKLLCHYFQDVCNSFMAEKTNKVMIYASFSKLGCNYIGSSSKHEDVHSESLRLFVLHL